MGNLKLPAGVNPVRVLDPVTVGYHDPGYGAVVFSGDFPESVTRLYGIGQIRGGVFHDRRGNFTVGLFSGAAVVSLILLYDIAGVVAGNDGSRVLRPFCIECFISRFGSRDLCNGRAGKTAVRVPAVKAVSLAGDIIGGRKNCSGAVSVAGYFFSAGNRTAVRLQRYGIGGEFPFCLEGHSAFDCIRVKVPFCFRTVVIIIPAFNTMPLIGGNGIRCGECRSVLTPIHFLCAGLIPIVWVKSDHEHTVQGGTAEITV